MAKLMLVEDDNNLREIYEARLQAEGYTIVSARDGEEALVLAKSEKPDLIISDVMMPKISGFEMLDILRNTEGLKDSKVIMLTALGQSDDQQRAGKLGADRYLVKSQVTLEDIVKSAQEVLNGQPSGTADNSSTSAPAAPSGTQPASPQASTTAAPEAATPPVEPAPAQPESAAPAASTPATPAAEPVMSEPVAEPPSAPAAAPETAQATPEPPAPAAAESAQPPAAPAPATIPVQVANSPAAPEANVEEYVAGATESVPVAVPDVPAPAPAAAEPAQPPAAPAPAADTTPATSAVDDKLIDDAVKTLVDSANGTKDSTPTPAPQTPTITVTPQVQQPAPTNQPDEDTATAGEPKVGNEVTVAHKKIIKPIESEPKKNLTELLAMEEAKESALPQAAAPATPQAAAPPSTSAGNTDAPAAAQTNDKIDPHSIAL